MTFIYSIIGALGFWMIVNAYSQRDRAIYLRQSTIDGIRKRQEADEARAERDRKVYELSRDLVDALAQDKTCHHDSGWWLGDRCRDCAIMLVKEAVHKAMEAAK